MHTNSETIPGIGTKRMNSIKTENLIKRYYIYKISKMNDKDMGW